MPEYLAPGVYVEEVDTGSKPIEGVSTSTAGMIGVTERGPVDVPILVTSYGEYVRWFGERLNPVDFLDHRFLPHAVEGFFVNGGKRVFVVRILDNQLARGAELTLFDSGNATSASTVLLRAAAENTGTAGNPPPLVVLSGASLALNDWIRVGDGSEAEYRQLAANPVAETVVVPLHLPLARAHAQGLDVEQFPRTAAGGGILTVGAMARGALSLLVDGANADIDFLVTNANQLVEVGGSATGEYRFVTGVSEVTPSSATNKQARVTLDSPLLQPYANGSAVQRMAIAPAGLAHVLPASAAGASVLFVDNRAGAFNNRTNLVVVDRPVTTQREVRRIGELHEVTLGAGVPQGAPSGTLIEPVTLGDSTTITVTGASAANSFPASDITTLSMGQTLLVGPAGTLETVQVAGLTPGVAPAGTVTTAAPLATPKAAAHLVIPVRRLTAAAQAGATFVALDNRMGLTDGDVLRIGSGADEEFAVIRSMPARAPAGVRPDAGNVILTQPLLHSHLVAGTQVVQQNAPVAAALQSTALVLTMAPGGAIALAADGNGLGPIPAGRFLRFLSPNGDETYHRVTSLAATATPMMVTVGTGGVLRRSHAVGSAVVERDSLIEVEALDAGAWGNRLRISVQNEAPGLVASTTLRSVIGPATRARLGSAAGIEPGTVLEVFHPITGLVVGGLLKVIAVDRATGEVTLQGAGVDFAQQAAMGLLPPGMFLGLRSREFRLGVLLLRQPDPAVPARNDTIIGSEDFRNLSMDPRHSRYFQTVIGLIGGPPRLADRRPEGDSWFIRVRDTATTQADLESIRLGPEALVDVLPDGSLRAARHALVDGGDSIATLTDDHYIGDDDPNPENRTGLHSLRNVEEISIVASPGRTSPAMQNALIAHCELARYRFAVLDGPPPPRDSLADITAQRQQFDTKYAALYHPWLVIPHPYPAIPARPEDYPIPPSGHTIGIYARTDIERGVHKAPANEVVRGVVGLQRLLNKEQHDILNPFPVNINVIRDFRPNNRGIRVYGGRVITSDSDWKYVNVRRLLIFIEASIDRGLQWVVFEINAEPLWARVRRSIANFLNLVWRNGGLEGTKPEEAFFVKCDRTTMTQTDIDSGRLICLVGVAPVKPAEFVIVRIGLWTAHADVVS